VSTAAFTRAVTIFAVGFLALDGVLFAIVNRFVWAAVCAGAALLVVVAWRRYRRAMADLAAAVRDEARSGIDSRAAAHQPPELSVD